MRASSSAACAADSSRGEPIPREFLKSNFARITDHIEYTEDFEKIGAQFLRNRGLKNIREIADLHHTRHDEKYEKEVQRKSRKLARFRVDNVNQRSKCTNQFCSNLHVLCGDGSILVEKKNRYANDNDKRNGYDSTCMDFLRSLDYFPSKIDERYIEDCRNQLPHGGHRRRSFSACHIRPRTTVAWPVRDKEYWFQNKKSIYIDSGVPEYRNPKINQFLQAKLTFTCNGIVKYCISEDLKPGTIIKLREVLFCSSNGYIYAIYDNPNRDFIIKKNSDMFEKWLKYKNNTGIIEKERWINKNVAIYLDEFKSSGVPYRRARHVTTFNGTEIFIELDTGRIRKLTEDEAKSVHYLPARCLLDPPAMVEMRFKKKMPAQEMTRQLDLLRSTKEAYVVGTESHNRVEEFLGKDGSEKESTTTKHSHLGTTFTLIIEPVESVRSYRCGDLTTIFCGETSCQGMCGTESFFIDYVSVSPAEVQTTYSSEDPFYTIDSLVQRTNWKSRNFSGTPYPPVEGETKNESMKWTEEPTMNFQPVSSAFPLPYAWANHLQPDSNNNGKKANSVASSPCRPNSDRFSSSSGLANGHPTAPTSAKYHGMNMNWKRNPYHLNKNDNQFGQTNQQNGFRPRYPQPLMQIPDNLNQTHEKKGRRWTVVTPETEEEENKERW